MNTKIMGWVAITWVLANALYPVALLLVNGDYFSSMPELIGEFFQLIIWVMIISSPSLFFGCIAMLLICRIPFSNVLKFLAWLLIAPAIALVNARLAFFFFHVRFTSADYAIVIPAMIAVFLASLVLYRGWFKTMNNRMIVDATAEK